VKRDGVRTPSPRRAAQAGPYGAVATSSSGHRDRGGETRGQGTDQSVLTLAGDEPGPPQPRDAGAGQASRSGSSPEQGSCGPAASDPGPARDRGRRRAGTRPTPHRGPDRTSAAAGRDGDGARASRDGVYHPGSVTHVDAVPIRPEGPPPRLGAPTDRLAAAGEGQQGAAGPRTQQTGTRAPGGRPSDETEGSRSKCSRGQAAPGATRTDGQESRGRRGPGTTEGLDGRRSYWAAGPKPGRTRATWPGGSSRPGRCTKRLDARMEGAGGKREVLVTMSVPA